MPYAILQHLSWFRSENGDIGNWTFSVFAVAAPRVMPPHDTAAVEPPSHGEPRRKPAIRRWGDHLRVAAGDGDKADAADPAILIRHLGGAVCDQRPREFAVDIA